MKKKEFFLIFMLELYLWSQLNSQW